MELTEAMAKVAAVLPPRSSADSVAAGPSTADVFISYAMDSDEDLAKALHEALENDGYSVWRATKIRAGEVLHIAVRKALIRAKAIAVLWTPTSVDREWVYAEARLGHNNSKLVPLKVGSLSHDEIPPPFNAVHTLDLDNLTGIRTALGRLGVRPRPAV